MTEKHEIPTTDDQDWRASNADFFKPDDDTSRLFLTYQALVGLLDGLAGYGFVEPDAVDVVAVDQLDGDDRGAIVAALESALAQLPDEFRTQGVAGVIRDYFVEWCIEKRYTVIPEPEIERLQLFLLFGEKQG